MGWIIKERLKTIIIFILIVTGLLQVGILWGYQSQGTPTSFLLSFFNSNNIQISDKMTRERFFVPNRLIMSSGNKSHWLLDRDSDSYGDLWNEARKGLGDIAAGKTGLYATNEDWGELFEKRGFIIDFGYAVEPALLKWFLGNGENSKDLPYISKVMVKPDIVDESISTYYIRSTDGRVFVSDAIGRSGGTKLGELIEKIQKEEKYRNYYSLRGGKIDKTMVAEPDVLYVNVAPSFWPYPEYSSKPPDGGVKRDDLADIVPGFEKDRYNISYVNDAIVQFNYGSNIYRYYSDGYLTYQYLGSADFSGKGKPGEALMNAYKLIDRISSLQETAVDIVLTSVTEKQPGVFSFTFDYKLKDMDVMIEVDKKDGSGKKLKNAIDIQADSKRVLSCDWLLMDFAKGSESNYNDRFVDLEIVKYTGLVFDQMHIRDMRAGYFISSGGQNLLKPMLLLYMKDNKTFHIEMKPQKAN